MLRTMGFFQQALGANVLGFTNDREWPRYFPDPEGCHSISPGSGPLQRRLARPTSSGITEAGKILEGQTLVSCHGGFLFHTRLTLAFCTQHNIPYWFVPHGVLDPYVFSTGRITAKKLWYWRVGRQLIQHASRVICSSAFERERSSWALKNARTTVIHWPVAFVNEVNRRQRRAAWRARQGIPEDAHVVLYLGRICPMKRPLETITHLATLGNKDVHLVICGPEDGVTFNACRLWAKKHDFNHLHLVPPVDKDERDELYLAADTFILLSHRENFGHTVAEAASAGLPIIMTATIGLAEELKAYRCNTVIEDYSPSAVKDALQRRLSSPHDYLADALQASANWVRNHLSYDLFRAKITALALSSNPNHHG
jgi:glycosyltransferase involved in cell wall biosynthesis